MEKKLRRQILLWPYQESVHRNLANYYLFFNAQAAKNEYLLAQDLYFFSLSASNHPNLLGMQSSPWQSWLEIENQRQRLESQLYKWQVVLAGFPDFQYAKLQLANLYYQLGDKDKALEILTTLCEENPHRSDYLNLLQQLN